MRLGCPIIDKDDARDTLSLIDDAVDDVSDIRLWCDARSQYCMNAILQLCPQNKPC